ncbi:hypothetical protein WI87_13990 [Burkholderia ubonensis]|uniref:DUF2827 domain-containing protein n=1 Tax=Burkholderia ubonensis TaxID=101571 RepID=UPI00075949CF|nr:DUF2827 domain-containing protein [Burkholderia ubonensis]KVD59165.1 hypothetical protein WI87_13990 [Burkholderia ubonensis]
MLNGRCLKIGITLYVRQGAQSIWENGVFQNCYFLAMLLKCSPLAEAVYLINGGDGDPQAASQFLEHAPVPVIDLETAKETLDVAIELSAQLHPDWARAFRSRGGHVIGMRVANDYVIDIERMMFGLAPGVLASGTPYSMMWTLPAFERSCAHYYQTAWRAPVMTMRHLWSPALLKRSIQAANGAEFRYSPGRTRWRLAILEPNICMVKTSHLAMLVADLAHRQDPDFIECLRVHNTLHLKNDPQFSGFAQSLDLVRHGLATVEARFPIHEIMGKQADAIISHHWENGQNYLYYEALYGGFPLIHNSALIGSCGYQYADFDCEGGAFALRRAFAQHDMRLNEYRRDAKAFLATLDPEAVENVEAYTAAIASLYQR